MQRSLFYKFQKPLELGQLRPIVPKGTVKKCFFKHPLIDNFKGTENYK